MLVKSRYCRLLVFVVPTCGQDKILNQKYPNVGSITSSKIINDIIIKFGSCGGLAQVTVTGLSYFFKFSGFPTFFFNRNLKAVITFTDLNYTMYDCYANI